MLYDYNLDNFLSIPTGDDKRIFIYDKNNNFKYSIIVDLSHWFVKNNCVIIKITNQNDIMLSFESRIIAQSALEKLDLVRKSILDSTGKLDPNQWCKFNTLNVNMMCRDLTPGINNQLALSTPVLQIPKSKIKIMVNNGSFVHAGIPDGIHTGCYFTSSTDNGDPTKARVNDGDVQIGDFLYWIGSVAGFDLDSTDYLDFEYLI